ncbi:lipopolysaccharide biosynthesis protein [Aureispira anguillae]|uniref:Polysaccharide biosynthesis C-terminal domain-containing protein n=1 Tax=Aureispira anguillae TaxID=2864201 RepID=A0A915YHJ7_9BACT|nr:polysaccharide biosynthesis C-terminal domain-containing protein [Aureispira anguillae]BDS13307.1 polysaccharide biosynthesis C-terminal domain-containing protein [Aureispira anguillae]
MSLLKKLAGETALYGLSSILGRLLTFVFLTPFLTNVFNENRAQMGIHTDIYAWAAFGMIIFTYRMETAFFRFGSKREDRATAYKTATSLVGTTTAIFVLLLIALSQPLANQLGYPEKAHYIVWFAFILGLDALVAIPFAMLRLEGKALKFAIVKLTNLFVHLGFVLFFLYLLPNYWPQYFDPQMGIGYVFIANLLASAVTFLLLLPTYWYKIQPHGEKVLDQTNARVRFDPQMLRAMLIYAMPLVLAGFAGIINEVLDRTLLKIFLEGDSDTVLQQLGVYGSCYKIAIFMNLFTQAFNYAAEPFFFRNAAKDYARPLYANIAFLFTLIGSIGFLGIMLFMDIVQFFVASNYREGLLIVPVLLLANLCLGLYYNLAIWFKLSDKTHYGAIIAVIGAGVTIIGNIILIPLMSKMGYPGYLGSAWATLLCYGIMVGLAYLWGQKHYPIPYPIARILLYITIVVLIYLGYDFFIQPYLIPNSLLSYLTSSLLMLAYLGVIILLDGRRIKQIIQQAPTK